CLPILISLEPSRLDPRPTPFPYTTLFRSRLRPRGAVLPRDEHPPAGGACRHRGDHRDRPGRRADPHRPRRTAEPRPGGGAPPARSEEHTSELQSRFDLVCRLLLEKKNKTN